MQLRRIAPITKNVARERDKLGSPLSVPLRVSVVDHQSANTPGLRHAATRPASQIRTRGPLQPIHTLLHMSCSGGRVPGGSTPCPIASAIMGTAGREVGPRMLPRFGPVASGIHTSSRNRHVFLVSRECRKPSAMQHHLDHITVCRVLQRRCSSAIV